MQRDFPDRFAQLISTESPSISWLAEYRAAYQHLHANLVYVYMLSVSISSSPLPHFLASLCFYYFVYFDPRQSRVCLSLCHFSPLPRSCFYFAFISFSSSSLSIIRTRLFFLLPPYVFFFVVELSLRVHNKPPLTTGVMR